MIDDFLMHKKSLVYTQKNLLCIHKRSLVHAQHSCTCSGPGNPGARAQKGRGPGLGPAQAHFLDPGPWVPWPRACTRVLCMHKRALVYTQEILLCIHNKCIIILSYYIIISSYHIIILYYHIIILSHSHIMISSYYLIIILLLSY